MPELDLFTRRRLIRFIEDYRSSHGQLPTLRDLEGAGFSDEVIKRALKSKVIQQFYVTLTNGTILKGFKVCHPD